MSTDAPTPDETEQEHATAEPLPETPESALREDTPEPADDDVAEDDEQPSDEPEPPAPWTGRPL